MIATTDPRHAAAVKALDAMHEFWKLCPHKGAVQWIEDTDGRLLVFTRGEYRGAIRDAIGGATPEEEFEEIRLAGKQ
jgi:hypothetical protein